MQKMRIVLCVLLFVALTHGYAKDQPQKTSGSTVPPEKLKLVRVFLLSGQSNMVGYGRKADIMSLRPLLVPPRDDVWLLDGKLPAKALQGWGVGRSRFGVEISFGHKLGDALDEPVVFIKAAWNGKSLWSDFRPPSAVEKRGGTLGGCYMGMSDTFARALHYWDMFLPELAGRRYELSGFVWFQGEADANRGKQAEWDEYKANLKDLIHDVRTSVGVPEMPALIIQMNQGYGKGGGIIREAQKQVAEEDPRADWVLTSDQKNSIHYDSASYLTIGDRCGPKMLGLLTKEAQNHRDNPAIKALAKKWILDRIQPPMTEKPDMDALCKGLYGYFPFDNHEIAEAYDGRKRLRKIRVLRGAAVQPVVGNLAGRFVDGIQGKAIRLKGIDLIHFRDFKEPVDDKGLLGDMTVSFWSQSNSKHTRGYRLGRGAGFRIPSTNQSWNRSWEANYAGWEICRVGVHGESAFMASMKGLRESPTMTFWPEALDGIRWSHIVLIYNRKTGEKMIWQNGKRPSDGKRGNPQPLVQKFENSPGIIAAEVPLAIGVSFSDKDDFMTFDELCMWNRVLTDEEIKTLYNNGHGIALPKD